VRRLPLRPGQGDSCDWRQGSPCNRPLTAQRPDIANRFCP
jgi:hypothetical protein